MPLYVILRMRPVNAEKFPQGETGITYNREWKKPPECAKLNTSEGINVMPFKRASYDARALCSAFPILTHPSGGFFLILALRIGVGFKKWRLPPREHIPFRPYNNQSR